MKKLLKSFIKINKGYIIIRFIIDSQNDIWYVLKDFNKFLSAYNEEILSCDDVFSLTEEKVVNGKSFIVIGENNICNLLNHRTINSNIKSIQTMFDINMKYALWYKRHSQQPNEILDSIKSKLK